MPLAASFLGVGASATNTKTFTAQAAGGYLICPARRNLTGNVTAIGIDAASQSTGWTKIIEVGPQDPASSAERVVFFGKIADGTETGITLTNMASGTRIIEMLYVAVPAGGGGAWKIMATKSDVSAGLANLVFENHPGDDIHTACSESIIFAEAIYSSSLAVGLGGAWPAFHTRHSNDRFSGSVASLPCAKGDFSNEFTYGDASNMRRTSAAAFVLGYRILPTIAMSAPPAGNVSGTVSLQATVSGGNIDVDKVEMFVDEATDRLIGSDLTSPYAVNWNVSSESTGTHNVYPKLTTSQTLEEVTGASRAYTKLAGAGLTPGTFYRRVTTPSPAWTETDTQRKKQTPPPDWE